MRIVLITSRAKGKDNIMAAAWCYPLSAEPPLFGVSLSDKRYSYQLVKEGKCFGINLVAPDMKEAALFCGTHSGKEVEKFSGSGLAKEEGTKINCPLIKESPLSIECKLVDMVEAGDHFICIGQALRIVKRRDAKGLYQKEGKEWIEI
jgi:flavin reductase (DIM6/NTAB) family NADH-FMN oxidoreductase RutF